MNIILADLVNNLSIRVDGPLRFRFLLQPLMATFFAFRDGRIDTKENRQPYFWSLITHPKHRRFLIKDGWKGIYKLFIIAFILDLIYQFIVSRSFVLREALIVAFILSIIPYTLLRGPFNRLMVMMRKE